jgi:hypothetical protein
MKTKLLIFFTAISALLLFQACKTKEKVANINEKVTVNNKIATNDTLPNMDNKTAIKNIVENKNEAVNTDNPLNEKKAYEYKIKDTIIDYEIINDPNLDPTPLKGYPINTPLPGIFSELFPDVIWELIYVNDGIEKMYRASFLGKQYTYDIINDFIHSYYKTGSVTDKKLVELCIFWVFHPDDSKMKIISTSYFENKVKSYYNYESIINVNNEKIEVYTLVLQNRIYGLESYKNGSGYKTPLISH